jgi:capsular polysaccharide biosynthesis protein
MSTLVPAINALLQSHLLKKAQNLQPGRATEKNRALTRPFSRLSCPCVHKQKMCKEQMVPVNWCKKATAHQISRGQNSRGTANQAFTNSHDLLHGIPVNPGNNLAEQPEIPHLPVTCDRNGVKG